MKREELTIELTALERAGKILPEDRNEVEKFADFLSARAEAKKDPERAKQTEREFYEEFYGEK